MPVLIEIDIRGHKIVALSFNEEKDGIPVIFIHGVKEGELHILEGVGHLPMFEKPKEYNSVIEKWIKRNI
jgi:hypothetical protein